MSDPQLFTLPPLKQLVGISYAARVGKDTAAYALVRDLGFTKFAFADELKQLAMTVDPICLPVPGYQNVQSNHNRLAHLVKMNQWEGAKDKYPEVRRFLENLGNGCRKHFGDTFWMDMVMSKATTADKAVISDVRFTNEAQAIKDAGGKLVKITRPGHDPRPFEVELDEWVDWDATIDNGGSIPDLETLVVSTVKDLFK